MWHCVSQQSEGGKSSESMNVHQIGHTRDARPRKKFSMDSEWSGLLDFGSIPRNYLFHLSLFTQEQFLGEGPGWLTSLTYASCQFLRCLQGCAQSPEAGVAIVGIDLACPYMDLPWATVPPQCLWSLECSYHWTPLWSWVLDENVNREVRAKGNDSPYSDYRSSASFKICSFQV